MENITAKSVRYEHKILLEVFNVPKYFGFHFTKKMNASSGSANQYEILKAALKCIETVIILQSDATQKREVQKTFFLTK